ncbi:tRNA glutamyl-Q(34) synthetase GluQRS [Vannielia sp. SX4]|uniref:tRNA glutamyl-Q(34) synthetase GluQRS n=1 Tax=Vannielia sp. SX4 TaxID=3463852 RepID=UPI004059BE24
MTFTTRFAPSPTGPLHLGHAYSAMLAHDMALEAGGTFLLRIEDIDQSRARPEWEAQIFDDLRWLGIWWPEPVLRQSTRLAAYRSVLAHLWREDLLFACTCNRRDIAAAVSAPQEGTRHFGPDGLIYPGTCRGNGSRGGLVDMPDDTALRLDMHMAMSLLAQRNDLPLRYVETGPESAGEHLIDADEMIETVGDVVLARRDMGTSYHLAVVIDDAAQQITHVVRGADLAEATKIHVVLQRLLGLPTPEYHHHRLIRDDAGKRLAKRDDARAIARYRDDGVSPEDIRRMVGL